MGSNTKEYNKEYYLKNKEKILNKVKSYNKEHQKEKKEYRNNNTDVIREYQSNYRNNNKEYFKEKFKEWKQNNPYYFKEYLEKNREKINKRVAINSRNRRKINPILKLKGSIGSSIWRKIKQKDKNTIQYLGCSFEEYKLHLEQQFNENMTWDNYGSYWEIDHIIPLSKGGSFHYTNTQPLSITENRKKYNKL